MITDDDLKKAFDRLARTPDGDLIYRYLQKTAIGITPADIPESALRDNEGRRRFAHELMGLMAKGMDESGGRTNDTADGGRLDRPIVFAVRQPAAIAGRRGSFRDYAKRHDPELKRLDPKPGDD